MAAKRNMSSSSIICLFVAACVVQQSSGAQRMDARRLLQQALHRRHGMTEPVTSYRFKRNAHRLPLSELNDVMLLDKTTTLEVTQMMTTVQGTQLTKVQEKYKGHTVSDGVVTLEMDPDGRHVLDASGSVYTDIDLDSSATARIDNETALIACLEYNDDEDLRDSITEIEVKDEVFVNGNLNSYLTYQTQYLVLTQNEQRRPTCKVNSRDGRVMMNWNALVSYSDCKATGTGGNVKIGKIRYGEFGQCLDVRRENGVCYLENKYVRVIDNNHTWSLDTQVASYNCVETDDEINGGYSPLLDAFFYGTLVGKMYEDWYKVSPHGDTMTFRVHYGVNYSNALYSGSQCLFGDGGEDFYPMISLDVVGHEVSHGFTERNSNLYYFQQWGAISEAFSDMAGETAEAYLNEADWVFGVDIVKNPDSFFARYLDRPEKDYLSISHASEFEDFMNVHHSSGVYNRAFYLLVHDYGLPIRDVFHVFVYANQMYWHHMSDYVNAACDVMKSAYDLGQDGSKFRKAFEEVGVEVCDTEDHVLGLRNGEVNTGVTVSRHTSPSFVFNVPGQFATSVVVNASGSQGGVLIAVSNKTWGVENEYTHVYAEGLESVRFKVPDNSSTHVFITLSTQSAAPLTDVTVVANYICIKKFPRPSQNRGLQKFFRFWRKECTMFEDENDLNED